jgi:FAD-dependent oxidoreductase domain-containing protein 1
MDRTTDVAIIGGAVVGTSVAWHLVCQLGYRGRVIVIEKDFSYARSATALSVSSIRQQFSCAANIRASLYGLSFIRAAAERFGADFGFREWGYLFLASEAGREALAANHAIQQAEGADILFHEPAELAARFPWLSTDGLSAGSWGRTGEGWFDGYGLMQAMRAQARDAGVTWLNSEATAIGNGQVALADGESIAAGRIVIAAGTGSAALAESAGIDIPVRARKRMVFTFRAADPPRRMPLLIDPTGVYARPEGEGFLCGLAPSEHEDPDPGDDYEPDWQWFEERIWPVLAARVPAFESIKTGRAWSGHYDLNLFDHNAFIGPWPEAPHILLACGFSGHGMQQAPATGLAIAEHILGRPQSLDLADLAPDRLRVGRRVEERNVW